MRRLRSALWWLSRPFVWRWRLGYWDWDASKVALYCAWNGGPYTKIKVKRDART